MCEKKFEYCFGIDIGGTTVKCGLFTVDGEVLDKWEIKTRSENNGVNILPDVAKTILDKMAEKQIEKDKVAGIGIGIPGPVDKDGTVPTAVNLHWGYVDVVGEMKEMTGGLSVMAANDANVAALGEMWKGGGAGYSDVVLVTLGTGVGGGIILGEKILAGSHGAGGEIGHIHVDDAIEEKCNCGNHGCLEQVASATGIVRVAKKVLAESSEASILRDASPLTAKDVWDAVKKEDALAIEVAKTFGKYLGTACATIANVVDPEVFVIGGGVSKAGEILIDYTMEAFRENAFVPCKNTKFAMAQLGNDAGIFGAARMVL